MSKATLEFQVEHLDKLADKLTDHYQELISAIAPYMPVLAHREMEIIRKLRDAKTLLMNPPNEDK